MRPDTIRAIFTNLLFVIGIILIVVGTTQGALTITRLFVFDKYPLYSYEESRCEAPYAPEIDKSMQGQDKVGQREKCLSAIENDRKVRMVEDIVRSVSFTIVGFGLAYAFRGFIFNKK